MYYIHGRYGEYPPLAAKPFEYTENTRRLRKYLTEYIYAEARPPTVIEFTKHLGISQQDVWDSMYQLYLGVQLMFVPGTQCVGKMPPFSFYPTRHRVFLEDGRKFWTGCAGESCAFSAEFPGIVCRIESICPASWRTITTTWKDGKLISYTPDTAIIHFGVHPRHWQEGMVHVCDNINFFASKAQVAAWEEAMPDRRGATMSIEVGEAWVKPIVGTRYKDYNRGPDVPGDPQFLEKLLASFKALGADVSNWEKAEKA
jgi:hypothetical protein